MNSVEAFELAILGIAAILALHWLASRLGWPPSIPLLIGGGALAFAPGIPAVELNPELVLVLLLPPLLMDGAWSTSLVQFRRHFCGILALSVGAILFTTLMVAVVAHWMMPALPWAACAALGAIVSPPDAISARTVLRRIQLPRRVSTLLEGESLLNDATGLVLFRFAVVAALDGQFDAGSAVGQFAILVAGGVALGAALGWLWVRTAPKLGEDSVIIVTTALLGWAAYMLGEALHVSGVIATVTAAMVLGWHQHTVFSASVRMKVASFWKTLTFLLEASVFMLIGFTLRGVIEHVGNLMFVLKYMALPALVIVLTLLLARFIWIFGCDALLRLLKMTGVSQTAPLGRSAGIVLGWASMRGVVTLAIALSLPEAMPERDFMLVTAFVVILVTVIVQGSTLGLVTKLAGLRRVETDAPLLTIAAAEHSMALAQLAVAESHEKRSDSRGISPQLLELYRSRASNLAGRISSIDDNPLNIRSQLEIILAAVNAGRGEIIRLHRAHQIDDETLNSLEHDLDLEESRAHAMSLRA